MRGPHPSASPTPSPEGKAGALRRHLDEAFPGRELISKVEAAGWLGISKKTMAGKYRLPPGSLVSKAALIREITR